MRGEIARPIVHPDRLVFYDKRRGERDALEILVPVHGPVTVCDRDFVPSSIAGFRWGVCFVVADPGIGRATVDEKCCIERTSSLNWKSQTDLAFRTLTVVCWWVPDAHGRSVRNAGVGNRDGVRECTCVSLGYVSGQLGYVGAVGVGNGLATGPVIKVSAERKRSRARGSNGKAVFKSKHSQQQEGWREHQNSRDCSFSPIVLLVLCMCSRRHLREPYCRGR